MTAVFHEHRTAPLHWPTMMAMNIAFVVNYFLKRDLPQGMVGSIGVKQAQPMGEEILVQMLKEEQ